MVIVTLGDVTGVDFNQVSRTVRCNLIKPAVLVHNQPLAVRRPVRSFNHEWKFLYDSMLTSFDIEDFKIAVRWQRMLSEST